MKMRVAYIPRPHKNKTYRYPFIVQSYRNDEGKPCTRTIMNLTALPEHVVRAIDVSLRGGDMGGAVSAADIRFEDALDFGHAWGAWRLMEQLGIADALELLPRQHRHAAAAMVVDRVVNPLPYSKRALHDDFAASPLARILGGPEAGPLDDWYEALESLLKNQSAIEKALFPGGGGRVFLYDITSSYFEGTHCPLAAFGYNRDGKKGKMQIVIGLLCDEQGRPVSAQVFEGNTADQSVVMSQVDALREKFGVGEVVFVGDRGMITSKRIEELGGKDYGWVKYITAIRRSDMMEMVEDASHPVQIDLFDEKNLVEVMEGNIRHILCYNPMRKERDGAVRVRLLEKTEEKLASIEANVGAGRLKNKEKIEKRLWRWINRWGMERFFVVETGEGRFAWRRDEAQIERYSRLDGCYIITTNIEQEGMETAEVVARYKSLQQVEKAFRAMKTTDLFVRPIRHWNADRVKGHVFMCMLAYLVIHESRGRLAEFLKRDPQTRQCEGDSLREIWKELSKVKIGVLKIGAKTVEQLNPLTTFQKQLLKALGAPLNKKELERLSLRN
jgi:transposase